MNVSMRERTPILLSEFLGQKGVYKWLDSFYHSEPLKHDSVLAQMKASGIDKPKQMLSKLLDSGVVIEAGNKLLLSTNGQIAWLLLDGINGGDLREIFRRISQIFPSLVPYDIVTEGMTENFIDSLYSRPDFKRVYVCSPWISLTAKMMSKFSDAIYKAESRSPRIHLEIIVIARPLNKKERAYKAYLETFNFLAKLGADVVLHSAIHTKLFIREPGLSGGLKMAVLGSENLTSKRNIELGIKIVNDSAIINKLMIYFLNIYNQCKIWKEEENE